MNSESASASATAVAVLVGVSAGCAAFALLVSPRVSRSFNAYAQTLERELRFLSARPTGIQLACGHAVAVALAVAALITTGSAQAAVAACCVAIAPLRYLTLQRRKRVTRIEQQLDGFLTSLAHALRANPALGEGLASTARVVAPPLAEEVRLLLHENALGSPLDRALDEMGRRIGSPVVSTALATLRVARMTGGDFVQTLETSAATLREMARLEGVVRTKTADGRAQAWVVAILPIPMMGTLTQIAPNLLAPLWNSNNGQILLCVASLMWLVAILAARRIAQVQI
jgi:tight adherence protein B